MTGSKFRYRHIEVAGEQADWVGIDPWLIWISGSNAEVGSVATVRLGFQQEL
jgi:hypothetical protein